ncbi:hypothetical protein [Dietzia sp. 179-F 9C3 NHS]|uniref:hypothetical protein n=1 Tax=Dietzia sp. 179-F 9C3 NHS TaxID=3374295 RepID=UPI0038798AA8
MKNETYSHEITTALAAHGIDAEPGSTGGGCHALWVSVGDRNVLATNGDHELPDRDCVYVTVERDGESEALAEREVHTGDLTHEDALARAVETITDMVRIAKTID